MKIRWSSRRRKRLDHHLNPQPLQRPNEPPLEVRCALPVAVVPAQLFLYAPMGQPVNRRGFLQGVFSTDTGAAEGLFTLPDCGVQTLRIAAAQGSYALGSDPLRGRV